MNKRFFLFYAWKEWMGGAYDFFGVYATADEARQAGIAYWKEAGTRLGSEMHLAELRDDKMKIIDRLNIPDTEQAEDKERLFWRGAA